MSACSITNDRVANCVGHVRFYCNWTVAYSLNTLLSGAEALGKDAFLKRLRLPVPSFAEGAASFIHSYVFFNISPCANGACWVQTRHSEISSIPLCLQRAQELSQNDGRRHGEWGSDAALLLLKWKAAGGRGCKSTQLTIVTTSTFRNEVGYQRCTV